MPVVVRKDSVSADFVQSEFAGKDGQMSQVIEFIQEKNMIPSEIVSSEVAWFYKKLGISDIFFRTNKVYKVAECIMAIFAAKILSFTRHKNTLDIVLEHETEHGCIMLCNSQPGVSISHGPLFEKTIDEKYMNHPTKLYRVETYRSKGNVSSTNPVQLRCYFVEESHFDDSASTDPLEANLNKISSTNFITKATTNTIEVYQALMTKAVSRTGPVIELFSFPDTVEKRLVIAFRAKSNPSFFSSMSHLYHFYDLYSTRKYVETFSNGMTIMSLYLRQVPSSTNPPISSTIFQIMKEISLLHVLPESPLHCSFMSGDLSVQEATYSHVAWMFTEHFLNRLGDDYVALKGLLDDNNEVHTALLSKIKKRLRQDTFSSEYIKHVIMGQPNLVKVLYANFAGQHSITNEQPDAPLGSRSLSHNRISPYVDLSNDDIKALCARTVANSNELMVWEAMLLFNKHVLKTNFYQPTKAALSFRLDPMFLPESEYCVRPFGIFFVIGFEFRGFHIRFQDVSRGGIRCIRSANSDMYRRNMETLFDESYNLANTQNRKNKDIPEGGSKGTILLNVDAQDKSESAFRKYVDAILDLLIAGASPGIKDTIVDLYGKKEILFFGPDEGTADFMNWASSHAHSRGASFWKAFTTGKSRELGGIPHDTYGMTTRSVHQYVLGILEKCGLQESDVTKFQTGGPDGDLGSNEIKISLDFTKAIVDGSGVLYDPDGIDRTELHRLAENRLMIKEFDISKLTSKGFRVLISDREIMLPNGSIVENGMTFRNLFHLDPLSSAMLFVPCGGRPEAVDLNNVHQFEDFQGEPRFRFIVEGANLFFTQQARLHLEKRGVIMFKDASANKGGVTSSSLEVFVPLALTDTMFRQHMCIQGSVVPPFYERYVKDVQDIIETNAALEFECIWREHERSGQPNCVISDQLSLKIVNLTTELSTSKLYENEKLRNIVISAYAPKSMINLIGLDGILENTPKPYLRAIFGAFLASRFVYQHGLDCSSLSFFDFVTNNFLLY